MVSGPFAVKFAKNAPIVCWSSPTTPVAVNQYVRDGPAGNDRVKR